MQRTAAHAHLYEACRDLHARLDAHPLMAGFLHPLAGEPVYLRTLLAVYAALAPAEAAVLDFERNAGWQALPYVPRTPHLARELSTLGATLADTPALALPLPEDLPSCLGYRYVLEGASLGSAWMLKRLSRPTQTPVRGNLDYLRYQAQMAGNWPRFTVALNAALLAESDRLLAASAARSLFAFFCRTLDAFTESHDPFVPR